MVSNKAKSSKVSKKIDKVGSKTKKIVKLEKENKIPVKSEVKASEINVASKQIKKRKNKILGPKKLKVTNELPAKSIVKTLEVSEQLDKKKSKKVKYMLPSKHITEEIVESCIKALHQIDARQKAEKSQILADETSIYAELHVLKIPSSRGNIKFVLPHSTAAITGEVCLITPDEKKGKRHDHEPTVDKWEELFSKAGVTNVKTILPMRQLRVEYDQYELKRRLLTQHDFVMVDTRILSHVMHILGNMFLKKHNMLIPVRINESKDLKAQIDVGLRTSMLRMGQGETSTILVGHTAMPQKHVLENVLSLVKQLESRFPGGERNIRSIALKLPLSLSLPIYVTLRPSSTITAPKLKQKKPKAYVDAVDELSTYPDSKVRVAPDGTVIFKKSEFSQSDDEDMDFEESHAAEEKVNVKNEEKGAEKKVKVKKEKKN